MGFRGYPTFKLNLDTLPPKTGWFKGSSSPNLWWIQRRDLGYEPSRQESHEDDRDLEEGMVSARCLIEFSKLKCEI